MRRNPFDELEQFFERMSRQFETWPPGQGTGMMSMEPMSVDVADRGDELVVTADLPGYEKEEINLSIADQTLHIRAEHDESTEEQGREGEYLRQERRHQSMSRAIRLPEEVDEENVSARYKNGVLTVTLPKRHASREESGHQIDIS